MTYKRRNQHLENLKQQQNSEKIKWDKREKI